MKPEWKRPPKPLSALQVTPDKIYIAEISYRDWTAVRVVTTKSCGWLRGDVHIDGFDTFGGQYVAKARVIEVETGKKLHLTVRRRYNDTAWMFINEAGRCTLYEKPDYLERRAVQVDEEIRALQERIKQLELAKEQLKAADEQV